MICPGIALIFWVPALSLKSYDQSVMPLLKDGGGLWGGRGPGKARMGLARYSRWKVPPPCLFHGNVRTVKMVL